MSQADSLSITSSPTPTPRSLTPYTNLPSLRADIRTIDRVEWLQTGNPPPKRRGVIASAIWDHGTEYISIADPDSAAVFICDHCDSVMGIPSGGGTSNIGRHMRDRHRIKLKSP